MLADRCGLPKTAPSADPRTHLMISVHGSSSAASRSMRANRSRQACRRVSSAESPMSKLIVLCSCSRIVVSTPCGIRSSASQLADVHVYSQYIGQLHS